MGVSIISAFSRFQATQNARGTHVESPSEALYHNDQTKLQPPIIHERLLLESDPKDQEQCKSGDAHGASEISLVSDCQPLDGIGPTGQVTYVRIPNTAVMMTLTQPPTDDNALAVRADISVCATRSTYYRT